MILQRRDVGVAWAWSVRAVFAVLVAVLPTASASADAECVARDFLSLDLPERVADPVVAALSAAYPMLTIVSGDVRVPDGTVVPLGVDRGLAARERIAAPTVVEQFTDVYPLGFDLDARRTPWFDPGRARNDAFFRALYFSSRETAAATMTEVTYRGTSAPVPFVVTTKHCVAAQLSAALGEIEAMGPEMARYFRRVGGGFNWRNIAGTTRLSAHSFGIAVDFDTELGGYWRWSGRAEGAAGDYVNRYPEELVLAMERRGFIWGGKWHHFDGMHFEYRPELILFSRLNEER